MNGPYPFPFFFTSICIRLSVFFWVYLYPLGRACLQMKLECTRGMFSFHWTTDFYNSPWKHMVNLYTTVAWCKLENGKTRVLGFFCKRKIIQHRKISHTYYIVHTNGPKHLFLQVNLFQSMWFGTLIIPSNNMI